MPGGGPEGDAEAGKERAGAAPRKAQHAGSQWIPLRQLVIHA